MINLVIYKIFKNMNLNLFNFFINNYLKKIKIHT